MAKEVVATIKLQIPAGQANPAPPVGPALGQNGVNIMAFCKEFNAVTQKQAGDILRVVITVFKDKTFSFINIFGLASTTKRCIGNKHFFILTASSDARTPGTFCFRSAWQNRIATNVFCTQFFRQSNRYGI